VEPEPEGSRARYVWSDIPDTQSMRRADAHAAGADGDEDDFGQAADDADLSETDRVVAEGLNAHAAGGGARQARLVTPAGGGTGRGG